MYIHFNLLHYFFLGLFCFLLNLLLVIVFSSSISKEIKLLRLFLCYLIFKFKFIFVFLSYTWNATKLCLSNKNNTRKIYYIFLSILWKSLLKPHCFLIFFLFNFIFLYFILNKFLMFNNEVLLIWHKFFLLFFSSPVQNFACFKIFFLFFAFKEK